MRNTIFLKVLLLCLAISSCTVLLIFFTSYFQTKDQLYMQANINLKEKSNLMMRSVDRFINERLEDLGDLAAEPAVINGSRNNYELTVFLKEFVKKHKIYESASYFDLSRRRLSDSHGLSVGTIHSKSKYWHSLDMHENALDISISESLKLPVMHFAQKVYSSDGLHVGYVVARMRIENLYNVFEDFLENDHNQIEQIEINMLDTNGVFLYSNIYHEKVLKEQYQYDHLVRKINGTKKSSIVIDRSDELLFVQRQNGYGNYMGSKWLLILKIDKDAIFAPVYLLRNKMIFISLLVLLLVTCISIIFSHFFTKPFRLMSVAAHEYGNGNFDYKFSLKTNDERKKLADLMGQMAEKLKFRIDHQEFLHKTLQSNMQSLELQKTKIEEQNNLIKSSIEYALKIQNAMLMKLSNTKNPFFQLNVFLKPRNIVSGDYYFFHKIKDEKLGEIFVIALVDCTGHGVAGAFMTIMAHNLLNSIVVNDKIINPGSILKRMNVGLSQMLNYRDTGIHHGMDLAICTYIPSENRLQFCGANRNLILVKETGALTEFKGVRIGLGHHNLLCHTVQLLNCEVAEITPAAGDRIYLYSDGITDQFGGYGDRKFSTKRLKSLFTKIACETFENGFTNIVTELNEWMLSTPQTDDMLLMGLHFNDTGIIADKESDLKSMVSV